MAYKEFGATIAPANKSNTGFPIAMGSHIGGGRTINGKNNLKLWQLLGDGADITEQKANAVGQIWYDRSDGKYYKLTGFTGDTPNWAEYLKINGVKRNGTLLTPSSNIVDVNVPTKISDLTNDSDFLTSITKSMVELVLTGTITTHGHNYTTSTDVQTLINTAIASVYKPKGNIANKTALLALTNVKQGDVYNAQSAFTLNGQNVKAGDNIVCISDASTSLETNWDNLGGNIDFAAALSQALVGFSATSGNISSSNTILEAINMLAYDKHTHSNKATLDAITAAFTTALKTNYDTAYTNSHTHTNKTVLDALTQAIIDNSHTHANKATLDAITAAFTTALKTSYDGAVTNSHTHSNKAILDAITAAFTTELQSSYATAVTNTHTHSNKAILDAITASFTTDLKTKLDGVTGTNTGDETTQRIGALINGATAKTTPVNADMVVLMDSTASNVIKRLSWRNIKATLKTYFDALYAKLSFASIKVGAENVDASRDSTVEFIAGTNVSLTANNTAKTITIAASETIQVLTSGGEILNYLTDGIYRLNLNHLTGNYPDSVCGTREGLVQPIGTEILRQYTGNNGNHDVKTQIMLIQNETYRRSGLRNYWNEWERLITCKDMANYATIDMLGTFDGEYLEPDVPVNVYRDTTYTIDGEAKEGKYGINLVPLFTNPPLEIIKIYIAISPQNQADYTLEIQLSDYAIDTRESSSSTTAHFGDYASITIPQGTSFVLLKIYMFENVSRCLIIYTFS